VRATRGLTLLVEPVEPSEVDDRVDFEISPSRR
jgi:hypothetical protein